MPFLGKELQRFVRATRTQLHVSKPLEDIRKRKSVKCLSRIIKNESINNVVCLGILTQGLVRILAIERISTQHPGPAKIVLPLCIAGVRLGKILCYVQGLCMSIQRSVHIGDL